MPKAAYYMKKFHLYGEHDFAFLSADDIAQAVNVSRSTAYRWIQADAIPAPYIQLLRFVVLGEVPHMPQIQVIDGELCTRTGYHVNALELEQYGKLLPQVASMARRLAALEEENRRLRAWLMQVQPAPALPAPDRRAEWFRRQDGGEYSGALLRQCAGEHG